MGAEGFAPARAALAGNPSDGYGGAVLAIALAGLGAHARANPDHPAAHAPSAGETPELVSAAVARFAREHAPAAAGTRIEWSTTIPRSVGLGGSSAIVIATLRALCTRHGVELSPDALAALALAVEAEDLGIAAGPQDRIAQSYGGLVFMDFATGRVERLDPAGLPPLLVAWRSSDASPSSAVHGDLRARWERGEAGVAAAMDRLGDCARQAREAVLAGEAEALRVCVDASFDARAAMLALDPGHVELVLRARAAGAAANYAGSGGAVVCVCRDERQRLAVGEALARVGCELLPLGGIRSRRR
jgi:glucuronokinase